MKLWVCVCVRERGGSGCVLAAVFFSLCLLFRACYSLNDAGQYDDVTGLGHVQCVSCKFQFRTFFVLSFSVSE